MAISYAEENSRINWKTENVEVTVPIVKPIQPSKRDNLGSHLVHPCEDINLGQEIVALSSTLDFL